MKTDYPLKQRRIFYLWRLDHTTELLPSKHTEFKALRLPAGVLYWADYYMQHFFKRGGIKPTILQVKGSLGEENRKEIERVWDKVLRGVYEYLAKVMNAEVITPLVLGEGIENLKDTELYRNKMADISVASGIPLSLLLADSANYATAQTEYYHWFRDSVVPWAEFIADGMSEQLFKPLGLRFEFRPEMSDPGQEDEIARASAFESYVRSGIKPSVAAQIVGIDLPADIEFEDLDPEPEPEPEPMPDEPDPEEIEEAPDPQAVRFVPTLEQYRELELWQTMAFRKAKRGEALTFEFVCKVIPDDMGAEIRAKLSEAQTEDDIKAAFDFYDYKPKPEPVSSALKAAIEAQIAEAETVADIADIVDSAWVGYP